MYLYVLYLLDKIPETSTLARFRVYRKGGQVCADREDYKHLWGLDLVLGSESSCPFKGLGSIYQGFRAPFGGFGVDIRQV